MKKLICVTFLLASFAAEAQYYQAARPIYNGVRYGAIGGGANYIGNAPQNGFSGGGFVRDTTIGAVGGYIGSVVGGPAGAAVGGFAAPIIVNGAVQGYRNSSNPVYGQGNTTPQVFGRRNCLNRFGQYFPC